MIETDIEVPDKLIPVFSGQARYRGAEGGRGSAKTRSFAKMTAVFAYKFAMADVRGVILCGREHLNSLDDSSMEEIKIAIKSEKWLDDFFEIGEKYIRTKCRRVTYVFAGLRHNLNSIKSKARILIAWIDEAEAVSEAAWRKLMPTVREDDSEVWVTWNPEKENSPTDMRWHKNKPDDAKIAILNWQDNPWFTDALDNERLNDKKYRPQTYNHIWEGGYLNTTDAQIFAGKFVVEPFEPLKEWGYAYYGADWGFSVDPTALTKMYIHDRVLYIREEANGVGVELDDLPELFDKVSGIRDRKIRADNARPETISHVKKKGFDIIAAKKWAGSVQDGIEFIKSFDRVVIHPDCTNTAYEFKNYSFKIDRLTEDVTTDINDKDNHHIDSIRYALEPLISAGTKLMAGVWDKENIIKPLNIPPTWSRWRTMYWSDDRKYSIGWYARDPQSGDIVRYRGISGVDADVKAVSQEIKRAEQVEKKAGITFSSSPANENIWSKRGHTIASMFKSEGIRWNKIPMSEASRNSAATIVIEALKYNKFKVTNNCSDFIESIPELREDEKRPGTISKGDPYWEEFMLSMLTYRKLHPKQKDKKEINPLAFNVITGDKNVE